MTTTAVTVIDPRAPTAGLSGWVHECGTFTHSTNQPTRCGECWSALRTGQAHNGHWQPATARRQQP